MRIFSALPLGLRHFTCILHTQVLLYASHRIEARQEAEGTSKPGGESPLPLSMRYSRSWPLPFGTRSPAQKITRPSPQKPSAPAHILRPIRDLCQKHTARHRQKHPFSPAKKVTNLQKKLRQKPQKTSPHPHTSEFPTMPYSVTTPPGPSKNAPRRPAKKVTNSSRCPRTPQR